MVESSIKNKDIVARKPIISPDIALLGAGRWGVNLGRNLAELGRLVAVADPDPRRLALAAEAWPHLRCYDDASLAMEQPEVGAVVIASPPETHFDLALEALEQGLDVFIEKPLALSLTDAAALAAEAEARGSVLMVGHLLAYHPAVRRLEALLGAGVIGEVVYVQATRWNTRRGPGEEDILLCHAAHDVSLVLGLLGRGPVGVQAQGGAVAGGGSLDVASLRLDFGEGLAADIQASWVHPFKEQRLVVVGSEGTLVFDGSGEASLRLHGPGELSGEVKGFAVEPAEPLRWECEAFLEALDTRQAPRTDGAEGLRVMRVLEAAASSLRGGGVSVDPGFRWRQG